MSEKKDRVVIEVDKQLKSEFKKTVESEGTTMKHVLEDFIRGVTTGEHQADKPTKGISLAGHLKKSLTDLYPEESAGATKAVEAYVNLRPIIIKDIERKVDGKDIALLASVLKKGVYDPAYLSSTDILISKVKLEADKAEKQQESDLLILIEKIKKLSPVECYFLQEEIFRRIEGKK